MALYIHIPYCEAKCHYCDFNSYAGHEHMIPEYTETLLKDAALWRDAVGERSVDTVFFGGGTPSLNPVEAVRTMSDIAALAEQHLAEYGRLSARHPVGKEHSIAEASVHSACLAAEELKAAAIAVFTLSGRTAFLVAAHRPAAPLYGPLDFPFMSH